MEDNEWFGVKLENYIKLNSKKTQENYTYLTEKYLTNNIGNYEINKFSQFSIYCLNSLKLSKKVV